MADFVAKGGRWVLAQAVLFAGLAGLAALRPLPFSFTGNQALGWILLGLGVGIALAASAALGSSLSPFPAPVESGHLVAAGPYRLVRHPIYTGVITGSVGLALARGDWLSLLVAAALLPFFYAKSIREESQLTAKYDDYETYCRQVKKRIVPGIL